MKLSAVRWIAACTLIGLIIPSPARAQDDHADAHDEAKESDDFYLEVVAPPEADPDPPLRSFLNSLITTPGAFDLGELGRLFAPASQDFLNERGNLLIYEQRPIRACFYGNEDSSLLLEITAAAREWEVDGSALEFDFGPQADVRPQSCDDNIRDHYDIRIGFGTEGTWSLVGTRGQLTAGRHTMEFDLGTIPENDRKRAFRHEFGHALGLEHEFRTPDVSCEDEIERDEMEAYLRAEWNMSDERIEQNFSRIVSPNYEYSAFDRRSVMNYFLPRKFFKQELFENNQRPVCFQPKRNNLSEDDKRFARTRYPSDPQEWTAVRRQGADVLLSAINSSSVSEAQKEQLLVASYAIAPWREDLSAQPYRQWLRRELVDGNWSQDAESTRGEN